VTINRNVSELLFAILRSVLFLLCFCTPNHYPCWWLPWVINTPPNAIHNFCW